MKLHHLFSGLLLISPLARAETFDVRSSADNRRFVPGNGVHAVMVNLDADPELEVYSGEGVMNLSNTPARTILPEPSRAPYNSAEPITWVDNCGDVADVDLDGDLDIVRQCRLRYNGGPEPRWRIQVLKNNGSGTFTEGWTLNLDNPGGVIYPGQALTLGDFDADGDADMVISNTAGVVIRWNGGHGTAVFDTTLTLSSLYELYNAEVADFDGDGLVDILAFVNDSNASVPRLVLYTNGGTNGGQPGVFVSTILATFSYGVTYQLKAADVDVDGRMDFLLRRTGVNSGNVSWYRNTGSGFSGPNVLYNSSTVRCFNMDLADVNEDGLHDLILTLDDTSPQGTIYTYPGTSPGSFGAAQYLASAYLQSEGYLPRSLCSGDADGDGDIDLVLYSDIPTYIRNIAVHHRAQVENTIFVGTAPSGAADLAVADVNWDGKLDLVAASSADNKLFWYSTATGSLGAPVSFSTGSRSPSGIVPGDFDADGDVDLGYTVPASSEVRVAWNNTGTGIVFQDAYMTAVANATRAYAEDANRDGKLDFVVASTASNSVRWFLNNGTGTSFTQESVVTGMANCLAFPMETFRNGQPEVLVFGTSVSGPNYLRSYRRSTSSWVVQAENSLIATVITAGDVNNDRIPDAIYASAANQVLFWPLFGVTSYLLGQMPGTVRSLEWVDWNNDGRGDVLCAWNGGVTLLLNGLNGWETIPFATSGNFTELALLDIDRDGRVEAVGVNQTTAKLHIFKNTSWRVRMSHISMADDTGRARIKAGQTGKALRIKVEHGSPQNFGTGDSAIYTGTTRLRFLKAVPSGQTYVPGAPLTEAEAVEVVSTVQMVDDAGNVRAALPLSPFANYANGYFTYNMLTVLQYAGGPRMQDIQLQLTANANTSANALFFVQHIANSPTQEHTGWWPVAGSGSYTRFLKQETDVDTFSALVEATSSTLTALETWRQSNFGTYQSAGDAANDADPNGDGLPNILEYVMGRDPKAFGSGVGSNLAIELIYNGQASPLQADLRLLTSYDSKVRLTLQRTTNLQTWTTLSTRTGTTAWTVTVPTSSAIGGGRTRFIFNTSATPNTTPRFWTRLKAEELP